MLSDDQINSYNEKGYLVVEGAIPADKLKELQTSIPKEVNKLGIRNVYFISAATGEGTKELLNALTNEISIIKSELA